jgi:N-acetylmuramoyl-L-alanine amidase
MDSNITVLYTRDSDDIHFSSSTKNDETGRITVANNSEADYFLSIHMARDDDPQKTGYSGYTREDDTDSQALYVEIAKALTEVGWTPDLGINYVNNKPEVIAAQTERPSLLIEIAYITNADEVSELNREDIQDIIAKAIAQGYYNYLKSLS